MPHVSTNVIRALVGEFAGEVDADEYIFPSVFEELTQDSTGKPRVTEKAMQNLLAASGRRAVNNSTLEALYVFFRKFIPNLKRQHLLAKSIETFENVTDSKFVNYIRTEIPIEPGIISLKDIAKMKKDFNLNNITNKAVFNSYRYAFMNNNLIIREVVEVFEEDSVLNFKSFFRMKMPNHEENVSSSGIILPIGNNYMFVGANQEEEKSRPRAMIMKREKPQETVNDYRVGIVISSENFDYEPCSCKQVFIRDRNLEIVSNENYHECASFFRIEEFEEFVKNYHGIKADQIICDIANDVQNSRGDRVLKVASSETSSRAYAAAVESKSFG